MICIYVGIAILAFVWRFVCIPWDFGGCFYQFWVALVGTAFFAGLYPRLSSAGQRLAQVVMFPIGMLLLFGSVYFAPQALSPFMFVAFVLAGALFLWSKSRRAQAILVSLLLVPLGAYCLYGYGHMALLLRLRSLQPRDVAELRFGPVSEEEGNIVVSKPDAVETIVNSLKDTHPYSPNHEGIEQPWQLTITMQDGSLLDFSVGSGNRVHPSSVWIEFGAEVYQNAQLRKALVAAGVNLWE